MTFKGYYPKTSRAKFVNAALKTSGIANKNWQIIERQNLAADYPSDFDVIRVERSCEKDILDALENHPYVKRVTPQHQVFRTLKYVNDSIEELKEFPRFTGRSSLSLVLDN